MRFMILLKADQHSEAGEMPSAELMAEMGRFNEELIKAGLMQAGEGLHPSSRGAKVFFSKDGGVRVEEGPFPLDGLLAGFWIWRVNSREEAIEWVKKVPMPMLSGEAEIEIRQVFDMEDFGEAMTPELREQEARQRAQLGT
ncbi:dehydrogenase [Massilia sp. KIM]|uniref:YciI family protein n=1 Tax=Massilia sp. KIM TaxID=1955422 RepID=UPI00098FFFC0|nr:YciI family protein [Massilia sp. KIM]OON61073.1 dehydrogenase [Massilia sp. KIM]